MTVLVDSDILIEVSRGKNGEILSRWLELSHSENLVLYSPVTAAELWAGALPQEQKQLKSLFQTLLCVPIDEVAGVRAGGYLQKYRRSHGVELADALIAAAAVQHGAALWTRNRKHFPMREVEFY